MAAKKKTTKITSPKDLPGHISSEIIEKIILDHEDAIEDRMGHLYNRFVGYIAEARLPVPQIVTVLQLLLKDAVNIADTKYKGGK